MTFLSLRTLLQATLSKFFFFFWCGSFLKSLLNLLQYRFCGFILGFWLWGTWDLNSPTRDLTASYLPQIWRQSLNHWTAKKVPTPLPVHGSGSGLSWYPSALLSQIRKLFILLLFSLWFYLSFWGHWMGRRREKFPCLIKSVCSPTHVLWKPRDSSVLYPT